MRALRRITADEPKYKPASRQLVRPPSSAGTAGALCSSSRSSCASALRSEHLHEHRHEHQAPASDGPCSSAAGVEWAFALRRQPVLSDIGELPITACGKPQPLLGHRDPSIPGHQCAARCAEPAKALRRIAIALASSTTITAFAAVSSLEVYPTPALRSARRVDLSIAPGRCRTNLN